MSGEELDGELINQAKEVEMETCDKEKPEYRCRLAAKEIKKDKQEGLFAATPPLEAKRVLSSLFACISEMCLDFIDVVRAYFHGRASRDVDVDLSREDHQEEMCGKGDVRHEGCIP